MTYDGWTGGGSDPLLVWKQAHDLRQTGTAVTAKIPHQKWGDKENSHSWEAGGKVGAVDPVLSPPDSQVEAKQRPDVNTKCSSTHTDEHINEAFYWIHVSTVNKTLVSELKKNTEFLLFT